MFARQDRSCPVLPAGGTGATPPSPLEMYRSLHGNPGIKLSVSVPRPAAACRSGLLRQGLPHTQQMTTPRARLPAPCSRPGNVMNSVLALGDDLEDFVDTHLTGIIDFESAPGPKPTIKGREDDSFEQGLVLRIKWAVYEHPLVV